MKRYISSLLSLFILVYTAKAQSSIDSMMTEIEKNSLSIQVLDKEIESKKIGNQTGIYLDNPEIGFNYLWGSPSHVGRRKDFSATQSFDFATILGYKRRVARHQNLLLDKEHEIRRQEILLSARYIYIDIVYYNSLIAELQLRLENAEIICEGIKKKLDKGDANILEYNNARINLSKAKGEIVKANTEREVLLTKFAGLNGGVRPTINDSDLAIDSLPDDFSRWLSYAEQNSPLIAYADQEIELSKRQITLSKAMWLPTLTAGYMSEDVVGEEYLGITLGMSVPIWENKNKVKQAKAGYIAADIKAKEARLRFSNQLETMFIMASGLKETAIIYKQTLSGANNIRLLKKAFDAGQISMLEYVMEADLYFDILQQALNAEREYQKSLAELYSFEL